MLNDRYRSRLMLVFVFFCTCYTIILANLFFIQIKHHSLFVTMGNKQYQTTLTTCAERAVIYDRTGIPLTLNKTSFSAFTTPDKLTNPEQLKSFLHTHFPQAAQHLHESAHQHFMYIKRRLTDEQRTLIEHSGCVDIKLLQESARFYPNRAMAHIVGITDIDNKGLFGIELLYDALLCGTPTVYDLQKDARTNAFYFKKETRTDGHAGKAITLTIDSTLQFLVHELLQNAAEKLHAQEITAIIMDPVTGHLLTMTSVPSFDPNEPINTADDLQYTKNRAVTETYELGSVIKIFAALAALQEKVVTPEELIDCKSAKIAYLSGRKITTWKGHGTLPFAQVIALSNNIGIAQIAERLDTKLYDHYIRLGFGQKTGIQFPGEQIGFVNPPDSWSKQSMYSLSYGYELRITLLQLARALSVLANGGYLVQPLLIIDLDADNEIEILCNRKPLYSPEVLDQARAILEYTTQSGTAHRARIKGYTIMTKTGSANLITNGVYDPTRSIFTCAGIVEKNKYKRVVVICVKEIPQQNVLASVVAVPLFEQVVQKMLIHEKIIQNKDIVP